MTSLKYNTFDNDDEEKTILTQPTILAASIEAPIEAHQCLICLQGSTNSKDEIKSINDMHFLKKTCNCICYSHHKCIETWIETNSVCPICKQQILFPQTKIEINKNDTLIDIPLINENENEDAQTYNRCRETARTYMCIMFLVFGILFVGNVFTSFLPA
jgi:hypothetical protein